MGSHFQKQVGWGTWLCQPRSGGIHFAAGTLLNNHSQTTREYIFLWSKPDYTVTPSWSHKSQNPSDWRDLYITCFHFLDLPEQRTYAPALFWGVGICKISREFLALPLGRGSTLPSRSDSSSASVHVLQPRHKICGNFQKKIILFGGEAPLIQLLDVQ